MKAFNEIVKEWRIAKGLTLRTFCKQVGLDPSNWSKIERGIKEPPKSQEVLGTISETLELTKEQFETLKDLALIGTFPKDLKPDKQVLNMLPIFFRTVRGETPTEEELKKLTELLKPE